MDLTLQSICERLGGELVGSGAIRITGISALDTAREGDVVYAEKPQMAPMVERTAASGIIVSRTFPPVAGKNLVRVDKPREAFVTVMQLFEPKPPIGQGVHPTAVVSPKAVLGPDVTIREHAVVRPGARIGRATVIEAGVFVGEDVVIGDNCLIWPQAVLHRGVRIGDRVIIGASTVVGGDGFGFVWAKDHYLKIPQLGTVIIEDDVELGTNMCVDRATFGATHVGRGTKTDNFVQIAHNDVIGKHVIIAGQVGLAGSVTVKDRVMFGGQAGVVDHVIIGEDVRTGAAAMITKDVKPGTTVWGVPARESTRAKRELGAVALLPKLIKKVRDQAAQIEQLSERLAQLERNGTPPASGR